MSKDNASIANECLLDVISHYGDFRNALHKMLLFAGTSEDKSYWQHQLNVLDRMKAQAEQVTNG